MLSVATQYLSADSPGHVIERHLNSPTLGRVMKPVLPAQLSRSFSLIGCQQQVLLSVCWCMTPFNPDCVLTAAPRNFEVLLKH